MLIAEWWMLYGVLFYDMFDAIYDVDQQANVRIIGTEWDVETRRYEDEYAIRKRSQGKVGSKDYGMASIVWRWDNPENPRNQKSTRGYPTVRLWEDLKEFYDKRLVHQLDGAIRRELRFKRLADLAENDRQNAEAAVDKREKLLKWREARDARMVEQLVD